MLFIINVALEEQSFGNFILVNILLAILTNKAEKIFLSRKVVCSGSTSINVYILKRKKTVNSIVVFQMKLQNNSFRMNYMVTSFLIM
jgi:TATA-box binding protein (TBP) (component of TFIID and TFIIIB)